MAGEEFKISLTVDRRICAYPVIVKMNGYAHKQFIVKGEINNCLSNTSLILPNGPSRKVGKDGLLRRDI